MCFCCSTYVTSAVAGGQYTDVHTPKHCWPSVPHDDQCQLANAAHIESPQAAYVNRTGALCCSSFASTASALSVQADRILLRVSTPTCLSNTDLLAAAELVDASKLSNPLALVHNVRHLEAPDFPRVLESRVQEVRRQARARAHLEGLRPLPSK